MQQLWKLHICWGSLEMLRWRVQWQLLLTLRRAWSSDLNHMGTRQHIVHSAGRRRSSDCWSFGVARTTSECSLDVSLQSGLSESQTQGNTQQRQLPPVSSKNWMWSIFREILLNKTYKSGKRQKNVKMWRSLVTMISQNIYPSISSLVLNFIVSKFAV